MDIENKTIWQQGSGDGDRNYASECLKWDVILNGPGDAGAFPDVYVNHKKLGMTSRKATDLRRFSEEMTAGDIVVLRSGTSRISGVGEIVGEYQWLEIFGDIDGWDLQHVRRVRWLWQSNTSPKLFPTYTLNQGDTSQLLRSEVVKQWLADLKLKNASTNRSLIELPLPKDSRPASLQDLSEAMFSYGVASDSINNFMRDINEIVRIADWYQRTGSPSEHETVAYLVIPFLRALGWTPQKMAVEWKYVDVALFGKLPREADNLKVVVEVKRIGNSCLTAVTQAEGYALKYKGCERLIVTDGIRYGVFVRKNERFFLSAYVNLTKLRNEYPIYDCGGLIEAVLGMTPEWTPDE